MGNLRFNSQSAVKTYSGSQESSTLLVATRCSSPKSGGCTAIALKKYGWAVRTDIAFTPDHLLTWRYCCGLIANSGTAETRTA
jgi:hypothetical protein